MTAWESRAREEAALFNPAFCGVLIHEAARGYAAVRKHGLPHSLAFMVLPLLLHRPTREALPRSTRTSMPVWLDQNPRAPVGFHARVRSLVPHTKEAILFGANHGLLEYVESNLVPVSKARRKTAFKRDHATDEVASCLGRADFVGKWLAHGGTALTVLALWGIRP